MGGQAPTATATGRESDENGSMRADGHALIGGSPVCEGIVGARGGEDRERIAGSVDVKTCAAQRRTRAWDWGPGQEGRTLGSREGNRGV